MEDRSRPKKKKLKDYAFRGLFRCGECGAMITAETQKGHNYYRCTKKIKHCSQPYAREEMLIEQVKEILRRASLCDEWTNQMRAELEKEGIDHEAALRVAAEKIQSKLNEIEERLGRLLDLHLDKLFIAEEFQQKKLELTNQKVALKQKLEEVRAQGKSWLEPMREFIIEANERGKVVKTGDPKTLLSLFKNIGSNFRSHKRKHCDFNGRNRIVCWRKRRKVRRRPIGGEGGIRTPDRGLHPYNGLANRRLQPLGHLSRESGLTDFRISAMR